MVTLPVFLPLFEATCKSSQFKFAAQVLRESGIKFTVFIKEGWGQIGPEEEEGVINVIGYRVEIFSDLLTKRLGLLALPPEPQDEPDAVVASEFPARIIGWHGEMAEEEITVEQQFADGRKVERKAKLSGSAVSKTNQVGWVDATAVGSIEILGAPEPFGELREAFYQQAKPNMSGEVEVMYQVMALDIT